MIFIPSLLFGLLTADSLPAGEPLPLAAINYGRIYKIDIKKEPNQKKKGEKEISEGVVERRKTNINKKKHK